MSDRRAMICISTGSDARGAIHSRGWEVPADDDAIERFAATLTEAYGSPAEWVSDETESPGRPSIVFYEGGRP